MAIKNNVDIYLPIWKDYLIFYELQKNKYTTEYSVFFRINELVYAKTYFLKED